jgi:hypothetical protein
MFLNAADLRGCLASILQHMDKEMETLDLGISISGLMFQKFFAYTDPA